MIMSNIKHEEAGKMAQVAALLTCICDVSGSDLD